ncbi:MAG: undecaprenyl-diphosphate phosphatase [Dehalococcoidia bacterium]|nr:undecaprenyl-diphosphate phosphatase [Dehalococcoidia bacterium]
MSLWEAFVLGLVQGLTEFLPISSSAHLILAPKLLGWPPLSLAFVAALHGATAVVLVAYFWRDWARLVRERPPLLAFLAAGSLPAVVLGIAFSGPLEAHLRGVPVVAVALIAGAIALGLAEVMGSKRDEMEKVGWRRVAFVGAAQALALLPGVSRLGITIAAGMSTGLQREAAARFSLLLGTPLFLAVGAGKLVELARDGGGREAIMAPGAGALAVGFITAAAVGVLTVRSLLLFLERHSLLWFVAYRLALGGSLLGLLLTGRLSGA